MENYEKIPEQVKYDLWVIALAMEPESLTCDGECTRSESDAKLRALWGRWAIAEAGLGFDVDVDEFLIARDRELRQQRAAQVPA